MIKISIRSRNISCKPLKELEFPKKVIYRMGSTTPTEVITKRLNPIEINSVHGCAISADKLLMKQCFDSCDIKTAEYWHPVMLEDDDPSLETLTEELISLLDNYGKIIVKARNSSGGRGIYLLTTIEECTAWMAEHYTTVYNYIFERYYTYSREYRVHVTKNGCFYASRKMLKNDAEVRWHRHHNNSIFVNEDNELFNKPANWDEIVTECIKALDGMTLDIAAFDVKVQNDKHENPKFIILESNTAPALGEQGLQLYKEQLIKLIDDRLK